MMKPNLFLIMKIKSILAAMFLMLSGAQTGWAQNMTVRMTNNETHVYKVPQVAELTFSENETVYEWVDLGLPSGTLWATRNVGAEKPEDAGNYFAWGETAEKTFYSWVTYKLAGGTNKTMKKYCTNSSYGTVDNLTSLQAEDDAATVNWNNDWQTPSKDQWQELLFGGVTKVEFLTQNEVNGMKVTSLINGASIFLPAAGYFNNVGTQTGILYAGTYCLYWSRTLKEDASNTAYCMYYQSSGGSVTYSERYTGLSVRPVRRKVQLVTGINLSPSRISLQVNGTKQIKATVLPVDADNRSVLWGSSNPVVATVDTDGKVTGKSKGNTTITCRALDGSNVSAECEVTVGGAPTHSVTSGREWVDLGLPSQTKWATRNIGANSPEENGYYFAWGETTTKDEYNWHNYHFSNDGSSTLMTKYITNATYGTIDNLNLLERADDAASVLWGASWQMPTDDQWSELIDKKNTTYELTTINGYDGIIFTSIKNGESIFFPAAGYHDEANFSGMSKEFAYWTRTLFKSNNSKAARFMMNTTGGMAPQMNYESAPRYRGFTVRAVLAQGMITPTQLVTNINLSASSLNLQVGKAQTLTATVLPANADIQEVMWESSDENVADVTQNGRVVGIANGTCTITCRATDGSDIFAECKVTVVAGDIDVHEFVDLGLPSGTLWATCNIGANTPEEAGNYFAWGETTPKDGYDWDTYKWCNGTDETITKYCTESSVGNNGFTDNRTELLPEDDAATANWGSGWQIPSDEQLKELFDSKNTTAEWTTQNGVNGRKFTSKSNGNSIFFPATGYRYSTSYNEVGSLGWYWSRSLSEYGSSNANDMLFKSDRCYLNGGQRCMGMPVRPVRKK